MSVSISRVTAAAATLLAFLLLPTACGEAEGVAVEPVSIEWFVGVGTGAGEGQIVPQQQIVDDFNASQDEIEILLTIEENVVASDILADRIRQGDTPDIIGPIGRSGSGAIELEFLDLAGWVDSGALTVSHYSEAQIEAALEADGRLTGLPFGVFPAVVFANRTIFEEAGEPLPPTSFGEPYNGGVWDMDALRTLAMRLTLDVDGNNALDPNFDGDRIVQWGFHHQWLSQAHSIGAFFGPGALTNDDGSAATPSRWLASWQWYHDLIWQDRAAPTQEETLSELLNFGNTLPSENLAMAFTHTWYLGSLQRDGEPFDEFELAVPPEFDGAATSKLNADTFRIAAATEHPDEAVAVLEHLLGDAAPELLEIYGSFPARTDLQASFESQLSASFPEVRTFGVIRTALEQPDIPSYEAAFPRMLDADPILFDFVTALGQQPDLNVVDASEAMRAELDQLFAAAAE